MIRPPEGLLGKLLALGICGLPLGLVYIVAVAPLQGLYDSREKRLQEQSARIERLRSAAQDLPRLREVAERWRERARDGELLLAGPSDAVAAAKLQSTVKEMVAKGGATLSSAETLPSEKRDNFQRVGIRISLTGNLGVLTTALDGIETAHPLLFLDNLEIRADAGGKGEAGEALTIALDVYGFRSL